MASRSEVLVRIDGASRGNPGPAAYAVVIESADGSPVASFAKLLGKTTNNFAEYQALLAALEYALDHGLSRIRVLTDSELMARQIAGRYKVKSPDLKPLHERARQLIAHFEKFSIDHVPREQNREADRLANRALDAASPQSSQRELMPANQPAEVSSLRTSAIYEGGMLKPHAELPLRDGKEVELEILRKK